MCDTYKEAADFVVLHNVIGDIYSLNVGGAAWRTPQKLTEVEVSKVGRKYFYVKEKGLEWDTSFFIKDWSQNTARSPTSKLYIDKETWEREKEYSELYSKIRNAFSSIGRGPDFTLEQIRGAAQALGLVPNDQSPFGDSMEYHESLGE